MHICENHVYRWKQLFKVIIAHFLQCTSVQFSSNASDEPCQMNSPADVFGAAVKHRVFSDAEADVQAVGLRIVCEIRLDQPGPRDAVHRHELGVFAGRSVLKHRLRFTIRHGFPLIITPNPAGVHRRRHPLRHLTEETDEHSAQSTTRFTPHLCITP